MEQSGFPGLLHMTADAARQLHLETTRKAHDIPTIVANDMKEATGTGYLSAPLETEAISGAAGSEGFSGQDFGLEQGNRADEDPPLFPTLIKSKGSIMTAW